MTKSVQPIVDIENKENQEDILVAEKRIKSPGRIWTMEEVEQELDLDDKINNP